ncbi:NADPH oxidase activator 1 isoform X3 [Syngnathus acus]|uniref:NADPH oxidase activator 1 isoform X3 n=1 Tax=Syngnathus acus TaxID=161584 RepID=UPI0018864535|nr:NADPH oxidase activator 1 isoform X3 [Syngnathus acus]
MEENYKAARNFNSKVSASHQKKITKQQDILIQSQLFTPEAKMLYTELLQLWNESVHAMDNKDWQGALEKLDQITEPTYRTLFNAASAHICLGQLDAALLALDLTIVKDQHLAVAFFQRAAVMMQLDRLDEALSDCVWAQTHLRGNMVIDYRQLGLRYKLYSWQVLHNAAAVYCRMDQWDQARDILISQTQGGNLEMALDSVLRKETLAPLNVPEGVVFRPRKKDVDQLKQRDFLGKSKVISSMIPNDDFGGFEPLRLQKPGYYQPKVDGAKECRYMCMTVPYMARGPGHLTVPGGSKIFLYEDQDKDGMATVIYDGQRGLVPMSLLKPADIKMTTGKTESLRWGNLAIGLVSQLHKSGHYGRVARAIPEQPPKMSRLKFAKPPGRHNKHEKEDVPKILLFGLNAKCYVGSQSNTTHHHPNKTHTTLEPGGGSIMVWRCFSSGLTGKIGADGKMDRAK